MSKEELFYIDTFEALFKDIQLRRVFADQKHFTDSIPKTDVATIIALYNQQKGIEGFDLTDFYNEHFVPAVKRGKFVFDKPIDTAENYIEQLWTLLVRMPGEVGGTIITIPKPFIVPGGRFNEIYYWDSYFTMLGLQVSGHAVYIKNMVYNFAYLIDKFGFIPNGNRTYFLSRSQPPFFSLMVELLAEEKGDNILIEYLPQMEKEYAFWMSGSKRLSSIKNTEKRVVLMPDGAILNRYWDNKNEPRPESYFEDIETAKEIIKTNPEIYRNLRAGAESGWDFSSRWLVDNNLSSIQTTDIVPVDLNCLLYKLELTIAKAHQLNNNKNAAEAFNKNAKTRAAAINKYLWNDAYVDYNIVLNTHMSHLTIAMAFPLFFKIASADQANKTALIVNEDFLKAGGVVTTLTVSGQQWDAPNGWAPLQWITYKGLKNYGFNGAANKIQQGWINAVETMYELHKKVFEKYNVIDINATATGGEYENQDGFGWTNGVYLKFKKEK